MSAGAVAAAPWTTQDGFTAGSTTGKRSLLVSLASPVRPPPRSSGRDMCVCVTRLQRHTQRWPSAATSVWPVAHYETPDPSHLLQVG